MATDKREPAPGYRKTEEERRQRERGRQLLERVKQRLEKRAQDPR